MKSEDPKKVAIAKADKPKSGVIHGYRNLMLLGLVAVLIALVTTSLELFIYRESGDIYLDRSRPGFLPDQDEAEESTASAVNYSYPETGAFDPAELSEYLEQLKSVESHLKKLSAPYAPAPLSDESLGITSIKSKEE